MLERGATVYALVMLTTFAEPALIGRLPETPGIWIFPLLTAGTIFAIYSMLVLGRSISLVPEARRLVTRGPYALVRHPLYLGEMVAVAGIGLQHFSAWALLLLGLGWAFQIQRMKYEEQVLSQSFPEYADYMARTSRLVPGVY